MRTFLGLTLFLLATPLYSQWVRQKVDTTASFRGLAVVNEKIVWASGTGGTVIRTIDGGKTWNVITVAGAEKLDFRDIEAFDANTAYILSIGNGDSSRIYKTTDGGKTWKLQFKNDDAKKFFDAIACPSITNCFAVSDPVDRRFPVLFTPDGADHWVSVGTGKGPEAVDGEAAFAASGTCLIPKKMQNGQGDLLLVSGGNRASVFSIFLGIEGQFIVRRFDTPIISGSSGSGIFSIAMFDQNNGVIVGGNYEKPDEHEKNLAFTRDGGVTWTLSQGLSGYRSAVTYVDQNTIIAVGTNGSDISRDGGKTWERLGILADGTGQSPPDLTKLDNPNLNAVQSKGRSATWAVGPKGLIVRYFRLAVLTK
jgi:photosystem II stability/assembly factor-like uncharacterized protein